MTKTKLPPATDWQARNIADWNASTFTQFIVDCTLELYGVPYAPGGGGSKSQRWIREKSMIKQAQGTYGNKVLRRFIEICWREYKPTEPYRYLTFTFAYSYLDRNFAKAQSEVARMSRVGQAEAPAEDLSDWL